MVLVGGVHPLRDLLVSCLRENRSEDFVTSAEVCQELIQRYAATNRRQAIADALDLLGGMVVTTFDVTRADIEAAHRIALDLVRLSGRDCLHRAVMGRRGVRRILTTDRCPPRRAAVSGRGP